MPQFGDLSIIISTVTLNQYNSLDYYADSDLGTITLGFSYFVFFNSFIW